MKYISNIITLYIELIIANRVYGRSNSLAVETYYCDESFIIERLCMLWQLFVK